MLRRHPLLTVSLAALAVAVIIWSCDRMEGDVAANQPPVVQFVNVPLDSSQFNYAPTVYWFGYDPDGLITAYQFHDDQSDAAVQAYRDDATTPGTLLAYINSLSPDAWTTTENTQETIYLLTAEGDTAEHVFMVRSVDNRGAYSTPKVRIFFRTNLAPYTPEIKKTAQDAYETEGDYSSIHDVVDTLFIGSKPSITWPGIQFIWKGTDPDSRELNIIPLEFSYRLTNLTTGLLVPYPRILDSINVEWIYDWSDWDDVAQVVYSGLYPNTDTGDYLFELRVRDDGLSVSDTNATATFTAIRPSFAKQLLIVDENKTVTGPAEPVRGGYSDSLILAFYYNVIPEAFQLAEVLRPIILPELAEPFVYDTADTGPVAWFRNKEVSTNIPYSLIHQFKWVWIIDDDNPNLGGQGAGNIETRQKAMGWYMNVGGQMMISGRRILNGSYNIPPGDRGTAGTPYGQFFNTFFNLQSANARSGFTAGDADFGGALTGSAFLPDLQVNPSVVCSLRWGGQRYCCLPQIDYFGRNTSATGYDYGETLYNYNSCTAEQPYEATNIDCDVLSSTATQAFLAPDSGHTRILEVSNVFNWTRGVPGEVIDISYNTAVNPVGGWYIIVSTPQSAGAWQTSDSLEVDYTYIPISINHDKPVASRFIRIEGVLYIDFETGDFSFIGETRFRSSLYTFPFCFLDTTHVNIPELGGDLNPVSAIVANELLFFNSPLVIEVGGD